MLRNASQLFSTHTTYLSLFDTTLLDSFHPPFPIWYHEVILQKRCNILRQEYLEKLLLLLNYKFKTHLSLKDTTHLFMTDTTSPLPGRYYSPLPGRYHQPLTCRYRSTFHWPIPLTSSWPTLQRYCFTRSMVHCDCPWQGFFVCLGQWDRPITNCILAHAWGYGSTSDDVLLTI
jgi:hypothetical protein